MNDLGHFDVTLQKFKDLERWLFFYTFTSGICTLL